MKYFIYGLLLMAATHLSAQKYYSKWPYGYDAGKGDPNFKTCMFDVSTDTFKTYDTPSLMGFGSSVASICDSLGNLLFYSNINRIFDAQHKYIDNSDSLSFDKVLFVDQKEYGGFTQQNNVILQHNKWKDKWMLLHLNIMLATGQGQPYYFNPLYYTLIEREMNGFVVRKKNQPILEGNFDRLVYTKHGNGGDWWIILPELDIPKYNFIKLDSSGVYQDHQQEIGQGFLKTCSGSGTPSISPDGSKYVRFENACGLEFFDFDRCEGTLSNPQYIALDTILKPGAGSAFSPNSRFLYISSNTSIYQIDTWALPLQLVEVAHFDGFADPFSTTFYLMDLQPDGKIYINSTSSVKSMHVIEYPDSLGTACQVKQHVIKLNTLNYLTMPKTPNHLLGVLEGSPCDQSSTSTTLTNEAIEFKLYPNPITNGQCILELNSGLAHAQNYDVSINNIYGMEVYKSTIPAYSYIHRMNLESLPSGVYFCNIMMNGNILATQKLVVQ